MAHPSARLSVFSRQLLVKRVMVRRHRRGAPALGQRADLWHRIVPDARIAELVQAHFDLRPGSMITELGLLRPIYRPTAAGATPREAIGARPTLLDLARGVAGAEPAALAT